MASATRVQGSTVKQNSLMGKLRAVPLFRDLYEPELLDIVRSATVRTYAKGSVVVREEEPGTSMFVILKGKAKVTTAHSQGAELLVAFLREGQFFGEMALISNQPRSATVTAADDTTVLEVSKTGLETVFLKQPTLRDVLERHRYSREQDTAERTRSHDSPEHRSRRRFVVGVPCRFRLSTKHGDRMITRIGCGTTNDISETGLNIKVDRGQLGALHSPLAGAKLRIELELPRPHRVLPVAGEVRWCRQTGQGADSRMNLGILITQMAKKDREAWLQFLNAEKTTHKDEPRAAKVHTIDS